MTSGDARCCGGVEGMFDDALARRDLERYRRRGPGAATRRLLAALREAGRPGDTLLDVGGGVGAIAHALLDGGAARATLVDASPSYLAAAREEIERRGTRERLTLLQGDLVDVADDVAAADVVTLDKVVCCYADMESLLAVSAARARRLYGLVYPRDSWWVRLAIAVENHMLRRKGSTFQSFIHRPSAIEAALQRAGLSRRTHRPGAWWVIAVYERAVVPGGPANDTARGAT